MICALCKAREANKKNTHYLTDGIIRTALNLEGSTEREKGLYFNMSDKSHVKFNFQRGTDIEKLEKELGRPATPEEIERAKKNAYAADYVFCDRCERIFTEIETEFIQKTLPALRDSDLSGKKSFTSIDIKTLRLFWYMQIWRSAVCEPRLKVSDEAKEELRNMILNYKAVTVEHLTTYPLLIAYLETIGGHESFTHNFVGFINTQNPLIIFMNDFVLQFSEHVITFHPENLPGFNSGDYKDFINYKEGKFIIRIVTDAGRRKFLEEYRMTDARERLTHYAESLSKLWEQLFHVKPSQELIQKFIDELTANPSDSILNYSKENITRLTAEFILRERPKQ